jgi:hypothetical protein
MTEAAHWVSPGIKQELLSRGVYINDITALVGASV